MLPATLSARRLRRLLPSTHDLNACPSLSTQENPYVSFCALDKASPKLMRMLFGSSRAEVGSAQLHTTPSGRVPVGELSMGRPEDFEGKDFDFYYTRQARQLVESGATTAEYRGPPREAKL
jgi:hypothetical protein